MIRYIIVLLLMSISSAALHAQKLPVDSVTKLVSFKGIVKVDSTLSAEELYRRSKEWFAITFTYPGTQIQLEEKDIKSFVGNGQIKVRVFNIHGSIVDGGFVDFSFVMQCKNGKYRYEFTRLEHDCRAKSMDSGGPLETLMKEIQTNPRSTSNWSFICDQINTLINRLIASLNAYMVKPTLKNDW